MKDIAFPAREINRSGLIDKITELFSDDFLDGVAKETKLVQRSTSKLRGRMFLALNVLQIASLSETSLNDQCDHLEDTYGVKMTKQSLDERYNTYSVAFMRRVFGHVLSNLLSQKARHCGEDGIAALSSVFSGIFLQDATSFQLPAELAVFYKSAGGDTSGSSIKIDLVLELLSGRFERFVLKDGKANDATSLQGVQLHREGLYIRDLGYFKGDEFRQLDEGGAYFLTRCKSNSCFYEKDTDGNFVRFDLMGYLSTLSARESRWLYYGYGDSRKYVRVRVVFDPLPEKVAKERLKKLKRKIQKNKKWRLTEERAELCKYNIFMCNFDERISDDLVVLLYSLRWQIELVFKIWKSVFKINGEGPKNIFRFECFLYGQLIALCLSNEIINLFREHLFQHEFELSELKAYRALKKTA